MLLSLYIGSLILGGVFVTLSVISGLGGDGDAEVDKEFEFDKELEFDKEFEFDKDFDLDGDADVDADADGDADGDGDVDKDIEIHSSKRRFRPYFSFKFYTFSLAFFGLTGTLLTFLWGSVVGVFLLSLMMGLASGLGMTYLLHAANSSQGGKIATDRDFAGKTAKVSLAIRPGHIGKVKLRIKGRLIEMPARNLADEEDVVFDFGEECLVLGIDDGVVQVLHPSQLERRKKG